VIPKDTIFIWEISLTWNIRNVMHLDRRIKEAEKMGFKQIIIPKSNIKWKYKIDVTQISNIKQLVALMV
jgi:DNA repair protein RadA/Sms